MTSKETAILKRLRTLATMLDNQFTIPGVGTKIGFDALIGMLPVAGDTVTGVLSAYIVVEAWRLGLPAGKLLRMALNIVVDTGVGAVPLAGDLFDVFWRANIKNLRIIEAHLGEQAPRQTPIVEATTLQ